MTTVDEPEAPAFDPDALRDKYRAERDKRLRPDGNEQYVEIAGQFAHYLDDPYVEPIERDPLFDEVDVVVIGGGFGGLLAGARLKEAGITDVRIIEKGGDFGGTWYWNRYPGAQCDIESYIYLPLLEEIGYVPKEKYTRAPEILEHSRNIGDHFGLYDGALFQTEVTTMTWDDDVVALARGDEPRRRAAGPLRLHGERPAAPPEAARHPRRRGLPGALVPHQPLGLRLHGRRLRGEPHEARRQARRHHRHGCHGRAGRAPRRGRGRAALRVPAHAVVDRRPQQPPDRPGVGGLARARLAEAADGELQQPRLRHPRARGPRRRRVDRHHRQAAAAHAPGRRRDGVAGWRGQDRRARRLRQDGADPRPRRHHRQRPEHGRGAEAVLPPVLQAAVLPRRVPRHVQPAERDARRTPTARASTGSPSTASSSATPSTRSTA